MSAGAVVWITGRPSSGKSTFAGTLHAALVARRLPCAVLDGDEMREALQLHDYSEEGRKKFYGTLAAVAALLARQGQVVLVPATAHRREYREAARSCAPRFIEVYLTTPHDECARRDPKGLYARALTEGLALPGVSLAYEPPLQPEVVASGGHDAEAVAQVVVRVLAHR